MKIKKINLPKVELFPCRLRAVKEIFGHMEHLEFNFARSYLHIPRYVHLKLIGLPIAHASY